MNLYEATRLRCSARKYLMEEIDDKLYNEIANHIDTMFPLIQGARYSMEVINALKDKKYLSFVSVKAPYYVCFSCLGDIRSYINAGYMLEMISAYLTQKGLGSCFVAVYTSKLVQKDGMKLAIVLAFGKTKDLPYREEKYAKRLPIEKVTIGYNEASEIEKNMIDMAILAPSAFNKQPLRYVIKDNSLEIYLHIHRIKTFWKKIDMISVGTAIANIMIVAEDKWQDAHVEVKNINQIYFSDAKYICTLVLDKGINVI